MITRIGCYLFGCDFGTRLPEGAPEWLKNLGTFPHWAPGTVDNGDGAPAYLRHMDEFHGTPLGSIITKTNASLPVHPTQIYESLVGLALLVLLLMQRRTQRFRGQIFFLFVFSYGYLRFLLEILRDDVERGEYGPVMAEHILIPGAMLAMSLGFVFGISLGIKNVTVRMAARAAAFVPPIVAFVLLKPPSFGQSVSTQLSTSQWIGVVTALLVSFFYARFWVEAGKQPKLAMSKESLGEGANPELEANREKEKQKKARAEEEDAEESDGELDDEEAERELTETKAESPKTKKKKREPESGSAPSGEEGGGSPSAAG
jgi:phosphatidylglycerol:prolipoprotein diacylglycerol transferase